MAVIIIVTSVVVVAHICDILSKSNSLSLFFGLLFLVLRAIPSIKYDGDDPRNHESMLFMKYKKNKGFCAHSCQLTTRILIKVQDLVLLGIVLDDGFERIYVTLARSYFTKLYKRI